MSSAHQIIINWQKNVSSYAKYQVNMFYNKSVRFKHSIQHKSGDLWDENIHKFDKKGQFFTKNTPF